MKCAIFAKVRLCLTISWGVFMASITKYAKHLKGNLYEKSYEYLLDNFHKFSEDNRIKIAIDMLKIFNKDGSKDQNLKTIVLMRNEIALNEDGNIRIIPKETSLLTG